MAVEPSRPPGRLRRIGSEGNGRGAGAESDRRPRAVGSS